MALPSIGGDAAMLVIGLRAAVEGGERDPRPRRCGRGPGPDAVVRRPTGPGVVGAADPYDRASARAHRCACFRRASDSRSAGLSGPPPGCPAPPTLPPSGVLHHGLWLALVNVPVRLGALKPQGTPGWAPPSRVFPGLVGSLTWGFAPLRQRSPRGVCPSRGARR